MNTSKGHYCQAGEQKEFLLNVFTRFCRFSRGVSYGKSSIWTGRNSMFNLGKSLNLMEYIEGKTRQFSILLL